MRRFFIVLAILGITPLAWASVLPEIPVATLVEDRALQLDEEDLQAQKDMVYWAKLMAWTSAGSVLISIGALGGLFVSLRQTGSALSVTRAMGQSASRAYVSLHKSEMQDVRDGGRPIAVIQFKNWGQSPAKLTASRIWMSLRPFPLAGELDYPPNTAQPGKSVLGPGHEVAMRPSLPRAITPAEFAGLREGRLVIFVYGFVEYEDVFGRSFVYRYRLKHGGDAGINTPQFAWCEDGNEADYFQPMRG